MRTVCLDGKPVQQSIDCTILARAVATNQIAGWKFDLYQGDTRMHGTQHFHGFTPAQPFLVYIRTYVYGIELHTHDVSCPCCIHSRLIELPHTGLCCTSPDQHDIYTYMQLRGRDLEWE